MRTHGTVEQVANSSAELRLAAESWRTLAGSTYGFSTETFIDSQIVTVVVNGAETVGFDLVIELSRSGVTAHKEYEDGMTTTPVAPGYIDTNLSIMRDLKRQGLRA